MESNRFDPDVDLNFDLSRHFVRITSLHESGLVEFEFSVGEPDMMVELIMPREAFDTFCTANQVTFLEEKPHSEQDWSWSLHDATHQRFR